MKNFFQQLLQHKLRKYAVFAVIGVCAIVVREITRLVAGYAGADEARRQALSEQAFNGFGMAALGLLFCIGVVLGLRQMKQELEDKKPFWMQPPKLPETPATLEPKAAQLRPGTDETTRRPR